MRGEGGFVVAVDAAAVVDPAIGTFDDPSSFDTRTEFYSGPTMERSLYRRRRLREYSIVNQYMLVFP